jgi:hypothetical protein
MDRAVKSSESGTTLIEVAIASMFLTLALMSVALSMGQSISALYVSQERLIAKQKAQEALESVIMAKNTQQIQFSQIANADTGGIFLLGFQPIQNMGVDGIPNTSDDNLPIETLTYPGPDGKLGTADDVTVSLSTFQRRITVSTITLPSDSTVDPDVRRIDVDVQYVVRGQTKTFTVSGLISRFS